MNWATRPSTEGSTGDQLSPRRRAGCSISTYNCDELISKSSNTSTASNLFNTRWKEMSSTRFVVKSDEERRGNLRQVVRGTTVRIETKTGETFIAELRDVSRSGIRFYASTQIPCGSQILVFPPPSSGLRPIRARIM